MHASDFVLLLVQLATMLACGLLGGAAMRLLRQPAVLGEMIGGIVLGPTLLGALAPEWQQSLFPTTGDVAALRRNAVKLGTLFFMFTIGLEINPRGVFSNGRKALLIGVLGTLVPLAAGIALVYALPQLFPAVDAAHRFPLALFLGAALANSANPVLARILHDLGLLKRPLGTTIMSASVIDDLISWTLLFVVFQQVAHAAAGDASHGATGENGGLGEHLAGLAAFAALTCWSGWIVSQWLSGWRRRRPEQSGGRIGLIAVCVLLAAAAAEHVGVHAFLGPFLFGVALTPREADAHDEAPETIRRFAHGFFVPIYFVSLGLTTDFSAQFAPLPVVVVLVAACVSKIPAAYAGARLAGLDRRTAWGVGWGMNARGAIGIILADLGLAKGVIDQPTYVALVVMALATSLIAAPVMKRLLHASATPAER